MFEARPSCITGDGKAYGHLIRTAPTPHPATLIAPRPAIFQGPCYDGVVRTLDVTVVGKAGSLLLLQQDDQDGPWGDVWVAYVNIETCRVRA